MASDEKVKMETRRFAPAVSGPGRDHPHDAYNLQMHGYTNPWEAVDFLKKRREQGKGPLKFLGS